jgi:hypothetical protein
LPSSQAFAAEHLVLDPAIGRCAFWWVLDAAVKVDFAGFSSKNPWKSVGLFHENYGLYKVHRQIDANRFD